MSRIQMLVDAYDRDDHKFREQHAAVHEDHTDDHEDDSTLVPPVSDDNHWTLGSRVSKGTDSWFLERTAVKEHHDMDFEGFDQQLHVFFSTWFSHENISLTSKIKVCRMLVSQYVT
jgi:hypothetical protein